MGGGWKGKEEESGLREVDKRDERDERDEREEKAIGSVPLVTNGGESRE